MQQRQLVKSSSGSHDQPASIVTMYAKTPEQKRERAVEAEKLARRIDQLRDANDR